MFVLGFFDRGMALAIIHLYSNLHTEGGHSTNRLELFHQTLNTSPAVTSSNLLLDRKVRDYHTTV